MAEQIAHDASKSTGIVKSITDEQRSDVLKSIAAALKLAKSEVLAANTKDMDTAREQNLDDSLVKRLDLLRGDTYNAMVQGVLDVANLPDPVGKVTLARKIDEGLNLYRVTVPLGVLLIIFESRPEVIANISALAIKSANCAILKGGKESSHSFKAIADIITSTLAQSVFPETSIQFIQTRGEVFDLLAQARYIDLVIPRGSNHLVRYIKDNTNIPVLGHADGICTIFVDKDADIEKTCSVVVDSKTNYAAACNAVEQLLVSSEVADDSKKFNKLIVSLIDAKVKLHVTPQIRLRLSSSLDSLYVVDAAPDAFDIEHLTLDISVDIVKDVVTAVDHINEHSSKHTDCIITENRAAAETFLKGVDSANVFWNCSTRFADGFRYGFGTEVGISTNKIHARGPVSLEGLMSYQYQMRGDGHIASEYVGAGGSKVFLHEDINF